MFGLLEKLGYKHLTNCLFGKGREKPQSIAETGAGFCALEVGKLGAILTLKGSLSRLSFQPIGFVIPKLSGAMKPAERSALQSWEGIL